MSEKGFFDEKDAKWIEWLKKIVVAMFAIYILAAVVLCICGWADSFWITDSAFLDGLIFLVGGVAIAFVNLTGGMLIVQLLNNIQSIRERLEGKES